MENIKDTLYKIAEDCLKEGDLDDCFLVDLEQNGTKVQVFIDTDEGVSFSQCQKLSRKLEAILDEQKMLGEKYILEVSSPGVSRPLKFLRQYPRNVGREIEVSLLEGDKIKGLLKEVDGDVLTIETMGKNKKETVNKEIRFDAVDSSRILISFGKKKMKK